MPRMNDAMSVVLVRLRIVLVLAALLVFAGRSPSATIVFTNDVGITSTDTNYDGLEIVVTNCTVTVDGAHAFASLRVLSGGIVTHSVSTGHTGLNLTTTGHVWVDEGGAINADGKGYIFSEGLGNGTQAGSPATGGGAGHGGLGGRNSILGSGGASYGQAQIPSNKGSTGGLGGGAGGGALRLIVGGAFILNGQVSANGNSGTTNRSGGGSGGSVWLTAKSISGTGEISANGGSGELLHGGGGGGGRVAIECETNTFVGSIVAHGGAGAPAGGAGTVYVAVAGANARLTVDNNGRAGAYTPVAQVTGGCDLAVSGGAAVTLPGTLTVGNLFVSSNSWLSTIVTYSSPGTVINLTVTGNVMIASQSGIVADASGFPGGQGQGRGSASTFIGTVYGSGGGYGGQGGAVSSFSGSHSGGNSYGSIYSPVELGSGGGGFPSPSDGSFGSPGGGAIRLTVGGALVLDGIISANGSAASPQGGGGGSGGSIWLTAGTMAGSGRISANGGSANPLLGGGGGGGRIAIYYSTNVFTGAIAAFGGDGANAGGAGTIYSQATGQGGHLLVDNGGRRGTTPLMIISGLQNLTIAGGALAQLPGSSPLGDLLIKSSSWVLVPANAQGLFLTVTRDATIEAGAGILADGKGFPAGQGPGSGGYWLASSTNYGGGGGHGGYGGAALNPNARGGNAYGSVDSPTMPGSGGGGFSSPTGGAGGGVIQLNVNGTLRLDGAISAEGGMGVSLGGGGGAGGGITVRAGRLTGAGIISANGGNANGPNGGGGGGGRIAISFSTNDFSGAIMAYGGLGANAGGAGTIYVKPLGLKGQVIVNNGNRAGTNTALMPGTYDLTVAGGGKIGIPGSLILTGDVLVRSNGWIVSTSPLGLLSALRVTGNAVVERGGGILADGIGSGQGRGYQSSLGPNGGGGYGGYGGGNPPGYGIAFGSVQSPQETGGPGGSASGTSVSPLGGLGGGALRVIVTGSLSLDGEISADGDAGEANSGGGAGGSVWLTAETLAGSGIISANGGAGNGRAGGGGGGRIAVYCNSNLFSGTISASGGIGSVGGGAGTIYTRVFSEAIERLLVDNGGRSGTNTPLQSLPAALELAVQGGAVATMTSSSISLSNLFVGFGSSVSGLAMSLHLAILGDAVIEDGGVISADGRGHAQMLGPGAGETAFGVGSGAGYGGAGGASAGVPGGSTYGSAERPADSGSGGGLGIGSSAGNSQGGGVLRLTVGRALILDGRLGANGNAGFHDNSGGGSGGSIWVTAGAIRGDGIISANGGAGEPSLGGGGGGGRIALYSLSNTFAGSTSVLGGDGAERGQNGTIYTSTNLPVFEVVSQQPTGEVNNVFSVSTVDLVFSSPFNPNSASASDVIVTTPNGILPTSNVVVSPSGPSTLHISFLPQSAEGDYTITIGPDVEDLFGRPMAQPYTGRFSFSLPGPMIQGVVRDTNGQPMAGVTLQVTGMFPVSTDAAGQYTLGVPTGWSGTVTPSLTGFMFVPGWRSYTNASTSLFEYQDYLIVETIAPALEGQLQGTNLFLNWQGIQGVGYQPLWSTNLVNWFPWGGLLSGSNGMMQLRVPVDHDDPMKFFRMRSDN